MAELLGLVASVIQVAGAGVQLSKTLYEYVDGVATADRRIKDIAAEIKMTSVAIEELGDMFKHEEMASLVSKKAVQTANDTITECSALFAQIDVTLKKSRKGTFGRLTMPFRETKLELLRSHVDKLKSTLQLLMQVLTLAHQVASRRLDRAAEARQREEIRRLLERKEQSAKRHDELSRKDSANNAMIGDVDLERDLDPSGPSGPVTVASIVDSTINAQTLATCASHVRTLLRDIDILQKALSSGAVGCDQSKHHQTLLDSYFLTRGCLDQVILGSSKSEGPAMPLLTRPLLPSSAPADSQYSLTSPGYSPALPGSPAHSPLSPSYSPTSPTSPSQTFTRISPCRKPQPVASPSIRNEPGSKAKGIGPTRAATLQTVQDAAVRDELCVPAQKGQEYNLVERRPRDDLIVNWPKTREHTQSSQQITLPNTTPDVERFAISRPYGIEEVEDVGGGAKSINKKTIESVQRREKIDDLSAGTDEVSAAREAFYRQAKRRNPSSFSYWSSGSSGSKALPAKKNNVHTSKSAPSKWKKVRPDADDGELISKLVEVTRPSNKCHEEVDEVDKVDALLKEWTIGLDRTEK